LHHNLLSQREALTLKALLHELIAKTTFVSINWPELNAQENRVVRLLDKHGETLVYVVQRN